MIILVFKKNNIWSFYLWFFFKVMLLFIKFWPSAQIRKWLAMFKLIYINSQLLVFINSKGKVSLTMLYWNLCASQYKIVLLISNMFSLISVSLTCISCAYPCCSRKNGIKVRKHQPVLWMWQEKNKHRHDCLNSGLYTGRKVRCKL